MRLVVVYLAILAASIAMPQDEGANDQDSTSIDANSDGNNQDGTYVGISDGKYLGTDDSNQDGPDGGAGDGSSDAGGSYNDGGNGEEVVAVLIEEEVPPQDFMDPGFSQDQPTDSP
ncbi:uncharacterized protein LOC124353801 [Homalodisca vitripennis]|uniref:uncharacterized protein LOC124353801 n=1 Tax=Homalodisca vitripennis TaxID=197043 RepID=UPI001EEB9775|nr:uncharacterized protein LOC124353801 [Homalodisca vitripennis]